MSRHPLVLFDIDRTLLRTGGAGTRAMARTARDLFGPARVDAPVRVAGRTDAWMVARIAAHHGVPYSADVLDRFERAYLLALAEEMQDATRSGAVCRGVPALLECLVRREHVRVGVLTGNFRRAAELKLAQFGLLEYFDVGAFGEDALEREDLLPVALVRAAGESQPSVSAQDAVIVGDTPFDISVATAAGAHSVAVATGPYSVAALATAGAGRVLPDFSDLQASVSAILDAR